MRKNAVILAILGLTLFASGCAHHHHGAKKPKVVVVDANADCWKHHGHWHCRR